MGKFIIKSTSNGQYRFNLKSDNGQVILTSESYTSNVDIESVKSNAPGASIVEE